MQFNLIYALQRKIIAQKMHAQVNKLYLHDRAHPYYSDLHSLPSQYIHRIQCLASMVDAAVRKKNFSPALLHRALFEVASNPCAQIKLTYHDLVDIKSVCSDYAHSARKPQEYAITIQTCIHRLLPRIPELLPCADTATKQTDDLNAAVNWYMSNGDFTVQEILQHTEESYLYGIAHTGRDSTYANSPPIPAYLMNLNAVIYSSLRRLFRPKYAKEDTSIIYWCCMYLRYCAPGLLDTIHMNQDAYMRTMSVLKILHNEWLYLLYKYK